MRYTNDTSGCYQEYGCDIAKVKKANGTLMKIFIPFGTKMLDVSYYDHTFKRIENEVLLGKSVSLRCDEVNNEFISFTLI